MSAAASTCWLVLAKPRPETSSASIFPLGSSKSLQGTMQHREEGATGRPRVSKISVWSHCPVLQICARLYIIPAPCLVVAQHVTRIKRVREMRARTGYFQVELQWTEGDNTKKSLLIVVFVLPWQLAWQPCASMLIWILSVQDCGAEPGRYYANSLSWCKPDFIQNIYTSTIFLVCYIPISL